MIPTPPSLSAGVPIDLPKLLETRALIQSNSGGGKSYCLRRVLETTAGHVQQLIVDPEGEFSTLREKFDYIICSPAGGDAVANPATAAALARALWGAGISAVLDIYELKAHERTLFVKRFFDSLVNAPRSMWHPTLVVLDEIHVYAPQATQCESTGAVIDMATRGRKRGLSLLGATQRLSKLHKDVAAELLNKIIGRTGLDVDQMAPVLKNIANRAVIEGGVMKIDAAIGESLAVVERRMILATLDHFKGSKERTAATLGVSLKTLYNRLKEYEADALVAEKPEGGA